MKKFLTGFAVLLTLLCTVGVYAADQPGGTDTQPPPPPGASDGSKPMKAIPPEAIKACTGKAVGTKCAAGPAGEGTCQYTPDKKYFACKPNDRGRRPPGPPPEK